MRRIEKAFTALSSSGSAAYIPYVCAGDPDMRFTIELSRRLADAGADIIEMGMPFSDPVADGPTIQAAMSRSLANGFEPPKLFDAISELRSSGMEKPVVVMTYYNPVLRMGVEEFCARLSSAGGDAVLVVDLPIEESEDLDSESAANGLDVIRLVAPSSAEERVEEIMKRATGFAYAVSVSGVTGERDTLPPSATELLRSLNGRSKVPVALGFGISTPEQVRQAVSAGAAGVVEGSALVNIYSRARNRDEGLCAVERHAREMKVATDGAADRSALTQ